MKILIEYKTDNDGWFYATTKTDQWYFCEVSKDSFDEAEARLIERVRSAEKRMPIIIPDPKEVETDDASIQSEIKPTIERN